MIDSGEPNTDSWVANTYPLENYYRLLPTLIDLKANLLQLQVARFYSTCQKFIDFTAFLVNNECI